jgi:hypothetical protein
LNHALLHDAKIFWGNDPTGAREKAPSTDAATSINDTPAAKDLPPPPWAAVGPAAATAYASAKAAALGKRRTRGTAQASAEEAASLNAAPQASAAGDGNALARSTGTSVAFIGEPVVDPALANSVSEKKTEESRRQSTPLVPPAFIDAGSVGNQSAAGLRNGSQPTAVRRRRNIGHQVSSFPGLIRTTITRQLLILPFVHPRCR